MKMGGDTDGYYKTSKGILEHCGEENVQNVIHCVTRLRFTLQDQGRVNCKTIEKVQGVIGTNISDKAIQENSSIDENNGISFIK
ncbi:PTS transporter subunit EIIB [Neobacillus sp. 3P2-tot-E-2]|uniref:PTS transporter subunit EIIB n=1 Tax=Neobacillus sp. 3P2-tot-E-2 TaxID=3132212 RepID=UPI0039A1FAA2